MKERIIELETRLAFQEQTIQALNGALIDQQRQIDAVQKELQRLHQRIGALGLPDGSNRPEEPPPHC